MTDQEKRMYLPKEGMFTQEAEHTFILPCDVPQSWISSGNTMLTL